MAVAPADSGDADEYPAWFTAFLADRAVRKPSPHTIKAYRQDFAAIAALLAGNANRIGNLTPADITTDRMRSAFATYARRSRAVVNPPVLAYLEPRTGRARRPEAWSRPGRRVP